MYSYYKLTNTTLEELKNYVIIISNFFKNDNSFIFLLLNEHKFKDRVTDDSNPRPLTSGIIKFSTSWPTHLNYNLFLLPVHRRLFEYNFPFRDICIQYIYLIIRFKYFICFDILPPYGNNRLVLPFLRLEQF